MVDSSEIITKSARETQELGEKIANNLVGGTVIALYGNLGSGKTTFIQGLAKGLGIKERILSPTFVIMREYPVILSDSEGSSDRALLDSSVSPQNDTFLFHVDLYRITNKQGVESLGLTEIWSDPKNIIAIEWPEKIANLLPKNRIEIYFEYLGEDERKIRIVKPR